MINRFEVTLNGRALTSLNDQLYITDIEYESAGYSDNGSTLAKRDGVLLQNRYYQSTMVNVQFELHVYDPGERHKALADIAAWAMAGGTLQTSDRSGMHLEVICEEPPLMKSAQKWTDKLNVKFVAYNPPYWLENTVDTLTLTSGTGTLYVHGNAGNTPLDAVITATEALTSMTLTANGKSITLSNLTVAANGVVTISHDENGILQIRQGTTSLLDKRTGADELIVTSGATNTLGFTASAAASCVFAARGRWY